MTALENRVRVLIARGFEADGADEEFSELAIAIHRFQAERCAAIARVAPKRVERWTEIPLMPTSLFARHRFATFEESKTVRVFRSSGTTAAARGAHHFVDLSLYRASALAGARWALGSGCFDVVSLAPRDESSSLSSMIEWMREEFAPLSGAAVPKLVIGAAFAFVPMIDAGLREPLPPGSAVIETGGYKGRSREIARGELHAGIARVYDLPPKSIVSEYGMCEISSPLWQRVGDGRAPDERGFRSAPWTRVRVVDPETLDDAEEGLIAIVDLANVHSSVGILTGDLGRLEAGGVRLLGRIPGVEMKGCSLMVDSR